MIELIGYSGGILLALCGVPLAINAIRAGEAKGISLLFLFMWLTGEILTAAYVLVTKGLDWPLVSNYIANIILILIVLKYKILPRGNYD